MKRIKQSILLSCLAVFFGFQGISAENQKSAGISCHLEPVESKDSLPSDLSFIEIPRLLNAPTIDGIIGEDEWGQAGTVEPFRIPTTNTNATPATKARIALDDKNLYVSFRCELEAGVKPKTGSLRHDDGNIWQDDSVELFIWPDGAKQVYFQFIINSIGTAFDSMYTFDTSNPKNRKSDPAWDPVWNVKTGNEKNAWSLEVEIPWSSLGLTPQGIRGIRFNCCRNVVPGANRLSSWVYLPKVNFHLPECFGIGICSFGGMENKQPDLVEIGLGTLGILRTTQTSQSFPGSDTFTALCLINTPKHPLFESIRVTLSPELNSTNLAQESSPPTSIGTWTLQPHKAYTLTLKGIGNGDYCLNMHFTGGSLTQDKSFFIFNKTLRDIAARLTQAQVSELSQKEPFKATAYMGIAACVEKFKRQTQSPDLSACVFQTLREIVARLDILERGQSSLTENGLLYLLKLTQYPDAQVVVEYFQDRPWAGVTFYWGAIPLTTVSIQEFDSKEKADAQLSNSDPILNLGEITTLDGYPARINSQGYDWGYMELSMFEPENQVLLVNSQKSQGLVLEGQYLDCAKVESVTLLDDCPEAMRSLVKKWAKDKSVPEMGLADALKKNSFLIAGNVNAIADKIKMAGLYLVTPIKGQTQLNVSVANRLLSVRSAPSRRLAEKAISLVIAGKAVTPEDVDSLRKELVEAFASENVRQSIPDDQRLLCGDVHMHTSYSDGNVSPAGLALESLYCFMDFIVISDHNTIEGAQEAQRIFAEHGISYPVIVGEEITTDWAHMNAYPLTKLIPWTLSPVETVKTAHEQGAVIQWNHPGISDFEIQYLKTGLRGTGFDAWEHYTWRYEEWKKTGELPVFIGSTDTHSGTFFYPERTIVISQAMQFQGDNLADAVRKKQVLMVSPEGSRFFYGSDKITALAWNALKDGTKLKKAKADAIRNSLKLSDIIGLLKRRTGAAATNQE